MRLSHLLAMLFCSIASVLSVHGATQQQSKPTQVTRTTPLTFFVYIARDNSLVDYGPFNIDQMKSVDNPNVNILVYDCFNIDGVKKAQMLLVTRDKATVLFTVDNADSGDETVFTQACVWVATHYPSDKLAIVAWNHGSGMLNRAPFFDHYMHRGFCYDDTTGSYLDDIKLMRALKAVVVARGGKKIDIFGFDACLMADVEIMAALAPYVNYGIASQQTIPGEGCPYDLILKSITKDTTALAFARQIVAAYGKYYSRTSEGYTLSAIDLSRISAINNSINLLAQVLKQVLQADTSGAAYKVIKKAVNSYYDESTYMDLYMFGSSLLSNVARMKINDKTLASKLQATLTTLLRNIKVAVVANIFSRNLSYSKGLSLYFPQGFVESSYEDTYFAQNNEWLKFIGYYTNN